MVENNGMVENVIDEGLEATFSTGSSKDGWSSTVLALRHNPGEPSAYYVDVHPIPGTGKFSVSVKKVGDCAEKQVYAALLKACEFHSENIPDNDSGPNYVEFGRYVILIGADHSWALGTAREK